MAIIYDNTLLYIKSWKELIYVCHITTSANNRNCSHKYISTKQLNGTTYYYQRIQNRYSFLHQAVLREPITPPRLQPILLIYTNIHYLLQEGNLMLTVLIVICLQSQMHLRYHTIVSQSHRKTTVINIPWISLQHH